MNILALIKIVESLHFDDLLIFLSPRFFVFPHCLQERLLVVSQESRSLHALSRDLLRLERSHVTRNGEECGIETSDAKINYYCHETVDSMNRLIDAFREFRDKLKTMVGLVEPNVQVSNETD